MPSIRPRATAIHAGDQSRHRRIKGLLQLATENNATEMGIPAWRWTICAGIVACQSAVGENGNLAVPLPRDNIQKTTGPPEKRVEPMTSDPEPLMKWNLNEDC